jgi:hypothetical protein
MNSWRDLFKVLWRVLAASIVELVFLCPSGASPLFSENFLHLSYFRLDFSGYLFCLAVGF